jgi:hypothetical protein
LKISLGIMMIVIAICPAILNHEPSWPRVMAIAGK